jgi:hypothetical protein
MLWTVAAGRIGGKRRFVVWLKPRQLCAVAGDRWSMLLSLSAV